ncbi:choice-of-anchor M domain-containing protein [Corynebacterium diphtheriae bv. gravis]|nr:choice-of-anchor M domain-containing protein [Corynebacterium diphtheriae bv. gravis]
MKIPHRRLVGAAATCFLVTGLASLPPTALAGPDQNKHTVYGTHMDLSPEAAVTGANHNLEGEDDGDGGKEITGLGVVLGLRKVNEETAEYKGLPADNAVMWLPRSGYYRFNSTEQTPFVAKQGDTVWQAPQNVDASQLPIYFGYNSGSHIQKAADNEELQNQNYSLDLLKVEGPGDVEVFTQTALRATRIFSSKDKAFRSLIKPRHSHYHTTFTKPGRYVFTYQATAYDSEGEPIKTMPMNLAWQVGGEQPDKGKILDPAQAWEKATKGGGIGKLVP